jgi:glutamate/tyrosine decarboxylase-like PLP-dependent enzyme
VSLNTVCFRYVGGSVPDERLDALNQEILTELQVRGIAVPSQTILGGRFAIRVCITNHRSELSDFDALVDAVLALGAEITERGTARVALSGPQGDRRCASPAGEASRSHSKPSPEAEGE